MPQIPLPLPHTEAMSADDFVVTASNSDAARWVNAWPEWPAHGLIITGDAGSGKTHLLKLWLQRCGGRQATLDELRMQPAAILAENPRLAFDDAAAVAGDATAEEALFHLYNHLREAKGFFLLTATKPIAQWGIVLPDLRSRLMATPATHIEPPDDELMSLLLVKQFHDRQIEVGMEVVSYLVPRIERTAAALRRVVEQLDHAALTEKRGITIALARHVLEQSAHE